MDKAAFELESKLNAEIEGLKEALAAAASQCATLVTEMEEERSRHSIEKQELEGMQQEMMKVRAFCAPNTQHTASAGGHDRRRASVTL